MLEEQDFKKIGELLKENFEANNKKIGEEVCSVIEQNVTPVLDEMNKEITGIKEEITGIKAVMVTKDDLNRGLADLKGNIILKLRDEDKKVNPVK